MSKFAPTFFFRYEDLYLNPQETLEKIFCFFLDVESVEGLNIQRRIKHIVDQGH
jgi:ABC-type Na+ transport system ATPase subunit NatA